MNLLIVDDLIYAVDGIKASINPSKLGIEEIYTAYSMEQAQKIFKQHRIDIVITDIEMPKGSGIDLIKWIRDENYKAAAIFLTSYAKFDYANQAIKLESIDYLLKPVSAEDLENALLKAIAAVRQMTKNMENEKYEQYWQKNQDKIARQFWTEIITETIPPSKEAIETEAAKRNIPYNKNSEYLIILIHLIKQNVREEWPKWLLEYALENIMDELLLSDLQGNIITLENSSFIVICRSENGTKLPVNYFYEKCQELIKNCEIYIKCTLACYIGNYSTANKLSGTYKNLLIMKNNNVALINSVFFYNEKNDIKTEINYEAPPLNEWINRAFDSSSQKEKDFAVSSIYKYLDDLVKSNKINSFVLSQFYHDFLQEIYSILKEKNIQAHLILQNEALRGILNSAEKSVEDMKKCCKQIIEITTEFIFMIEQTQTIIDKAKIYIAEHLQEDLRRENIAAHTYLNPEYLSRLFKKKTGMLLSEYITEQRINHAKKLLMQPNLSISEVAIKSGYANISYFSKIFKQKTGLTPIDFRSQKDNASKN